MEIKIRTKNLQLTSHLKNYIRKKLEKVEKFLVKVTKKGTTEMEIEVEKITRGQNKGDVHRVEAQIFGPGISIRAEDTSTTPKEAVSEVKYELERQLKEHKDKKTTLQRKGARKVKKMRGKEM